MEALDWCMQTHLDDNLDQRVLCVVMNVMAAVKLDEWEAFISLFVVLAR
jgi:hypothetical protein